MEKEIVKHIKKHYGSNMKIGTVTKEVWSDKSISFMDMFREQMKYLGIDVSKIQYTVRENYCTSFDLGGKVYLKDCEETHIITSDDFRLVFAPHGKFGIELYKIQVHKKGDGLGTKILQLINLVSTRTNTTVYLRPQGFDETPIEKLREWYKRNGYRRSTTSVYWNNK
jgi:hypothetical protein